MSDYENDYYYDDEDQPQFGQSSAPVAGAIDENGHLQAQDLWGVQTRIFNISLPTGVTLETLQAKHKNGVYWEMPSELKQSLRQVNKLRNRTNATDEELVGDLGKFLFLSAEVISEKSNSPKDLAVDIPGLVPTNYTSNGRHNWVIEAGNGNPVVLNENIFEPDNYFTKQMYEHEQKCDLKTLATHINLNHDPEKQIATMETQGVGWKVLTDNMAAGRFADCAAAIYENNKHVFEEGNTDRSYLAKVPYDIAEEIYEAIATPLKEIEKSYTDINTFRVRFSPADGEAWTHSAGLIQESYGFDSDSKGYEKETLANKPIQASIRLRVKYVLSD